jgi:hypothetical protein
VSHETQQSLEKDGFRALLSVDAGQVVLRSRHGTEMLPAFPEIGAGARQQLPGATALEALCDLYGCLRPKVSQWVSAPGRGLSQYLDHQGLPDVQNACQPG